MPARLAVLLAALVGHLALNATGEVRALRYLAPVVPLAALFAVPVLSRLPRPALALAVASLAFGGAGARSGCTTASTQG
jgi:hypothetical protein